MWEIPSYRRFLERLSSFTRLVTLDRRGVGCSDRLPPGVAPTLEDLADDVVAVMQAVGTQVERAQDPRKARPADPFPVRSRAPRARRIASIQ
jgi:hypothetical protein